MTAPAPLDWFGCATFRLRIGELVIFLDAHLDRVATAPRTRCSTACAAS
jgi:L-ascorbate metabolism protein UlaG (beta-lactamase superfamily)